MKIPEVFCWTKFGTEAGETDSSIRARKEAERLLNGGVFLWGIGNSIRPSLFALLSRTKTPQVVFTPMISRPAKADVAPMLTTVWCAATGLDGLPYHLPDFSVVTSRASMEHGNRSHYALVCQRDASLEINEESIGFDLAGVRNLVTGNSVGSSQVTSVVEQVQGQFRTEKRYEVAFRASLVYPYFLRLSTPIQIPGELRLDNHLSNPRRNVVRELIALRNDYLPESRSIA